MLYVRTIMAKRVEPMLICENALKDQVLKPKHYFKDCPNIYLFIKKFFFMSSLHFSKWSSSFSNRATTATAFTCTTSKIPNLTGTRS